MGEGLQISFIVLVDILALVQSIIFGGFLILRSSQSKPTLFLGVFILTYGLELIPSIMGDVGYISDRPYLIFLPLHFYFLTMPALYIYSKELTVPMGVATRRKYLLPGLIEIVLFSCTFLLAASGIVAMEEGVVPRNFIEFYFYLGLLVGVFFVVITIRSVRGHRQRLPDYYSNGDRKSLRWLELLCYGILFLIAGWVLLEPIGLLVDHDVVQYILSLFNAVIIFWAAFQGLIQHSVHLRSGQDSDSDKKVTALSRSTPSSEASDFADLQAYMHTAKPFLNSDLQLYDLASALEMSSRKLSLIISTHTETNFRGFVNKYRVYEAQRLLREGSAKQFTMLGIAHESGFNSKATFYAVFKELSGCSPGDYKSALSPLRGTEDLP